MKKLLLLVLISAGLFAARYPIVAEYYFMNSCVNAGKQKDKMIGYCACTLNEIEQHYTLNQFIQNMKTNKEAFLKKISQIAIPKCINQLAK